MIYLVTDPGRFDVVVTDNLFGDIFTDLAAAVSGGIGLAASGNLDVSRTNPSMFEPVHGSAPDIAGTVTADPTATVLSIALLLDHLGMPEAARRVEAAVAFDLATRQPGSVGPHPGHRRPAGGAGIELIEHRADRDELSHVMSAASAVPPRHAPEPDRRTSPLGDAFHVFDTTLRDGAQREGITLLGGRQARRRNAARRTRSRLHRGWLARRHAQGHRVLPPRHVR